MVSARIREFLRFCVVGFAGFVTDASMLELFVSLGIATPIARILSIAVALQVSYGLHGIYTFRDHSGYSIKRWLHFLMYNALGAALNYGTFLIVLYLALLGDGWLNRQFALLVGTAFALGFNYTTTCKFVFRRDA